MAEENKCPLCKGVGYIITPEGARLCQCQLRNFNLNKYLQIPRKFFSADLNKVKRIHPQIAKVLEEYIENFPHYKKEGKGIFIYGPVGVGKTFTIVALLKKLYEKYRIKSRFVDVKTLSIQLKNYFGENSDKAYKLVNVLSQIPILVLDDLGKEVLFDWYYEVLTYIISERYNQKRITFFTSQYPPINASLSSSSEDLQERYGPHIVSRILETSKLIKLEGKDLRLRKVHWK
jgi:DNA replication protein DnaC